MGHPQAGGASATTDKGKERSDAVRGRAAVGATAPRTSAVPTTTERSEVRVVPPYALFSSFAFQTANTSANEVLLIYINGSGAVTSPLFWRLLRGYLGYFGRSIAHEQWGAK